MTKYTSSRAILALFFTTVATVQLSADEIETKDGARLVGKVTKIDGGTVSIDTSFAGTLSVKQSEIVSIATDAPLAVRLASGNRLDGKLSTVAGGTVQIGAAEGVISTPVANIAASWAAGGKDPALAALERHWAYEAAIDVNGKTGNKEQLGTAASLRAMLKTPSDTLQFYTAYDRQTTDGAKSADQFKAGADYQNNFSGSYSWYVRNEGGFDRVKDIELYNITAAGFGLDVIKKPKQTLTMRAGLSFRYEGYKNPLTTDVKSAGLDVGLAHDMGFSNSKLTNRISFVPSFKDTGNYRINHESFFEFPLVAPNWKLRLGLSNDYNSLPGRGVKRLDTAYFTRFVLNWQ